MTDLVLSLQMLDLLLPNSTTPDSYERRFTQLLCDAVRLGRPLCVERLLKAGAASHVAFKRFGAVRDIIFAVMLFLFSSWCLYSFFGYDAYNDQKQNLIYQTTRCILLWIWTAITGAIVRIQWSPFQAYEGNCPLCQWAGQISSSASDQASVGRMLLYAGNDTPNESHRCQALCRALRADNERAVELLVKDLSLERSREVRRCCITCFHVFWGSTNFGHQREMTSTEHVWSILALILMITVIGPTQIMIK